MAEVDHFVFLDDVQLARQSWQTRNRVIIAEQVHWIVIPIRHVDLKQTVAETEIAQNVRWRQKLGRMLRQTYARHPYAADTEELITFFESGTQERLGDLNTDLVMWCAQRLGISTSCRRSGTMALKAKQRTERLVEICRSLGCNRYLSPAGSSEYLEADGLAQCSEINLEFARYAAPVYSQHGAETFVPNLSIVDVVANLGWKGAAGYVLAPWQATEPVG